RPETIEASLLAQMADWPSRSTGDGGHPTLEHELRRHAEAGPITILFDGFAWPEAFPQSFPPPVRLIFTMRLPSHRPAEGEDAPSLLDLNGRHDSNEDVCREYLRVNRAALARAFPDIKRLAFTVYISAATDRDRRFAEQVRSELSALDVRAWSVET